MRTSVYLETTVISYLAARPHRDLVTAAHQQVTHDWWTHRHNEFDLYVSELVIREASAGDPDAAARRLTFLEGIAPLAVSDAARSLAGRLIQAGVVPVRAAADALHVALAAVNGIDYLLTWNCQHIANARMRARIENTCRENGYEPPVLCTPEELLGEDTP